MTGKLRFELSKRSFSSLSAHGLSGVRWVINSPLKVPPLARAARHQFLVNIPLSFSKTAPTVPETTPVFKVPVAAVPMPVSGWFVRSMSFILALSAIFLFQPRALAFVANEIEKGIIEMRSVYDRGLIVTEATVRQTKNKTWVYFCVAENIRSINLAHAPTRCFYGERSLFQNINKGTEFLGIEYGLRPHIVNDKGLIPVGMGRHFYLAFVVR